VISTRYLTELDILYGYGGPYMPMNANQEAAQRIMLAMKLAGTAGFLYGAQKDSKRAVAAGVIGAALGTVVGAVVGCASSETRKRLSKCYLTYFSWCIFALCCL